MKKILVLAALIAATSLIAATGYSQVLVGARIGPAHLRVGFPVARPYYGPRAYYAPAPIGYAAPASVYGGYYADPAVCETDFPGYAYYDYPAWNGHFRDRAYFDHYRPAFYRDHRAYFGRGGFDHARFEHGRGSYRGRR